MNAISLNRELNLLKISSFVNEAVKKNAKIICFDVNIEELNNERKGREGHMKNPFYLKDRRTDLYSKYI